MKIAYLTPENTLNFIRKSIYDLENQGVHPNDIKVLIPEFYKISFEKYHREMLSFQTEFETVYGKEILPHYKNEIVVYDKMYFKTNKHFRVLNLEL